MEPITLVLAVTCIGAIAFAIRQASVIEELTEEVKEYKLDIKLLDRNVIKMQTKIDALELQLKATQSTTAPAQPKPYKRTVTTSTTTWTNTPPQSVQSSNDDFTSGIILGNMLNSQQSVPATEYEYRTPDAPVYTPEPESIPESSYTPSFSIPGYSSSYSSSDSSSSSGYSSSSSDSSYSSDSSSSSSFD